MIADTPPLALDTVVFARGLRLLGTGRGRPSFGPIDLDILPGEIFVIVGRAGSGKTALIESLVGLRPVSAEQLNVCGADPRTFAPAVKQRIGVAPSGTNVERHFTVEEALDFFGALYERRLGTASLLDMMDLQPFRHRPAETLPPAVAQRFSLALALVNDPVVLFADDPTRDLDPDSARRVWHLLRTRRDDGRTSVITTNHLEEAERLGDRIAVLDEGRLVDVDTPAGWLRRARAPVRVVFDLPRPEIDLDVLGQLDGAVGAAHRRGDTYAVSSNHGFATMRALIRLLDQHQATPRSLAMHHPSFEDVFFELMAGARTP